MTSKLLIHRGLAKKNFTENTITAFRYCFKRNYGIETDIPLKVLLRSKLDFLAIVQASPRAVK